MGADRERRRSGTGTAMLVAGFALVGLVGLAAIAVGLLGVRPFRTALLENVIDRVGAGLPGELTVNRVEWPRLGALEFREIRWIASGDTLAAVDSLALEVRIREAFRGDVHVEALRIEGARLDLPALQRTLGENARPPEDRENRRSSPFPRFGSIPPLPSVAIDELRIDAPALRLAADSTLSSFRAGGSLELRRGRPARFALRDLEILHPPSDLTFGPGDLEATPDGATGAIPGTWGADWPFAATVRTTRADGLVLDLALVETEGALRIEARRRMADGADEGVGEDVGESIEIDLELRSPTVARLAAVPQLAEALSALPPSERLTLRATGAFDAKEPRAGHYRFAAGPFAGIDSLGLTLRTAIGEAVVEDARVVGPGLEATAGWTITGDRHSGAIAVDIRGLEWAAAFLPTPPPVDSVWIAVRAEAEGPAAGLRGTVRVSGGFVGGETRIDSMDVALDGVLSGEPDLGFRIATRVDGTWVTGAGSIAGNAPVRVTTSPWTFGPGRVAPPAARPTTILFSTSSGAPELRVDDLRVDGPFGPFRFDGTGKRTAPDSWNGRVRFALPAPSAFLAERPDGPTLDDLGPVSGLLTAEAVGDRLLASVDAGATDWLDEARITLRREAESIRIDTLAVAVRGARIDAAGDLVDGRARARARISVEGDEWPGRFGAELPESTRITADLELDVAGEGAERAGALDAQVRASSIAWSVPALVGRVDVAGGVIDRVRLDATEPIRFGERTVSVLTADVRPSAAAGEAFGFPARVSVRAEADTLRATFAGSVDGPETWRVDADSVEVGLGSRTIRAEGPFVVRWDPAERDLAIDDASFAGDLGRLRIHGSWGPEASDLRAEGAVRMREALADLRPDLALPAEVSGAAWIAGPDSVRLELLAEGLPFDERKETRLRVDAAGTARGVRADIALESNGTRPLSATLSAPYGIRLATGSVVATGEPWSVDLQLDGLPVPIRPPDLAALPRDGIPEGTDVARLAGSLQLAGKPDSLIARLDARATFPGVATLEKHGITLAGTLSNREASGSADPAAGLRGHLEWNGPERRLVDGSIELPRARLALPAVADTVPISFTPGDSLSARLQLSDWTLDDLAALLPPDLRLGGNLDADLRIDGDPVRPRLQGFLEGRDLSVATADGDRVRAHGRLEFAGTSEAPEITGKLEVTQGRLLIPDPPRLLHDERGDALLWTANVATPPPPPPAAPADSLLKLLDLGVDVAIPGSFWIRGRGLDVEMAGDLALVLRGGLPSVRGDLEAVRGTLAFFGTRFEVQRGVATFYGDTDADPDLDILLMNRKGDVSAFVHVTGRASAPALAFTSEPPLEEADILAHLLFGRASSDLDGEQTGFLETQATAALQMFAIPGLENQLGWRLGLDLVQLRPGTGEADSSPSIVVGKYLSPRALIKYDQGLDRGSDFAIRFEYWLSRHLRLQTTTSRQAQSGLDVHWTSDD